MSGIGHVNNPCRCGLQPILAADGCHQREKAFRRWDYSPRLSPCQTAIPGFMPSNRWVGRLATLATMW